LRFRSRTGWSAVSSRSGGEGWSLLVIRFGSDSLMIVRSAWPYWRCSGPIV
jgi:hypothetical protein